MRLSRVAVLLLATVAAVGAQSALEMHQQRAKAAQARRDYIAAAAEWKRITSLAPDVAEAHANLGMMLYFAQKPAEAIAPFQRAITLSPTLVGPHLFLGICSYLVSRPQEAVQALGQALRLEPQNALARKWLGLSYLFAGRLPEGIAALEQARTADPKDAEILFHLSRGYGRVATDSLRTIRESWPDSAWDHLVRAEQYRVQGRDEDAQRHLSKAARPPANAKGYAAAWEFRQSAGETPDTLYALATAARAEALKNMEGFASLEPGSYRLHQLRGEYEEARENAEMAEAEYRKALALRPQALHLHLALGNLQFAGKRFEEAIAEYTQELAIDPYSAMALMQTGLSYRYLRQNDKAVTYLKRSLEINEQSAMAHKEIGMSYLQMENAAMAIQHLERANALSKGGDETVFYQLSRAYRLAGRSDLATKYQEMLKQRLSERRDRLRSSAN